MANYIKTDINQHVFLNVDFLKVLEEGSFEHSLYHLLNHVIDLSEFHDHYKNGKVGRKAYPPELLLCIVFYAYYRGITSSRRIAQLCHTDLKFMALACGHTPHFTTIADFVSSRSETMKPLFHKLLLICCKSGLVGKKHFAIDDNTKNPDEAARHTARL